MIIQSSAKQYKVIAESDSAFAAKLIQKDDALIVIDRTVYELYHKALFQGIPEKKLFILEAAEENKTIDTALRICEIMTDIPAKRNAWLISFGGGIVQDVTGFAANILYRGVNWAFVPTTLLAACDSCIGGKTSLNYHSYKNLLGTFFAPNEIHICADFFSTLSDADYKSGLGEVVKFNVMRGERGIDEIERDIGGLLSRNPAEVSRCVERSLQFKKQYIEKDEFDRGIRAHLNFAHTFGHAYEAASRYRIPHGTAVAMGTIAANRISASRGWLDEGLASRMEDVLLKIIPVEPETIAGMEMDVVLSAIRKDKKQVGDSITAVLFDREMHLQLVHDLTQEEAETGTRYVFDRIRDSR